MAPGPKEKPASLPVRSFGVRRMSGADDSEGHAPVSRPDFMTGDDTAFMFHLESDDLMPVIRVGTLMYCSKLRDPTAGDIVLLVDKADVATVAILSDVNEDGMAISYFVKDGDDGFRSSREFRSFDDLKEVAVVVATRRSLF